MGYNLSVSNVLSVRFVPSLLSKHQLASGLVEQFGSAWASFLLDLLLDLSLFLFSLRSYAAYISDIGTTLSFGSSDRLTYGYLLLVSESVESITVGISEVL